MKCTARGSLKIQDANIRQNLPSGHHRTTLSGCIFATKTCIDNQKKLSYTCPRYMATVGALMAEIGLPVWGTPANFNGFRVLASLLQRRRSPEASQTLHDVWPSPGLANYVYTWWRRGVAVTSLGISTRLLYVGPG